MDSACTRDSGIPSVGALPWGSHFCQFYRSRDDLRDVLVPYFKAGLEAGEQCCWVTSDPLGPEDARALLRAVVPDLPEREARGQIEILDHRDWYRQVDEGNADAVLGKWIQREQRALERGYAGLRLTGNTYWLERDGWQSFCEYESVVNQSFRPRRIIALCSYCTARCGSEEILDVLRHHQFAVVRRDGDWDLVESASLKIAKQELQRLNEDLEARVRERTTELEAALRVRDEFLSVASHELRTPIATMKLLIEGMVRASERGRLTPEQTHERLTSAREELRRLDRLVTNLLDVSRAPGALRLHLADVDLVELTRTMVTLHADQLRRAGCTVSTILPPELIGRWDPTRLEQVVSNLLSNAARHAPGANVEVSLTDLQGCAALRVRDDGPGIPDDDRPHIFERFAQAGAARAGLGLGLGLGIVRRIVEALAGEIQVDSAPGRGATFTVLLPRSGPAAS